MNFDHELQPGHSTGGLEQVNGNYFVVLGFRSNGEMNAARDWVLQQGWHELLS